MPESKSVLPKTANSNQDTAKQAGNVAVNNQQPPREPKTQQAQKQIQQTSDAQKIHKSKFKFSNFSLDYYLPWITGILLGIWITQLLVTQILSDTLKQQITENAIIEQQQSDQLLAKQSLSQYQSQIESLSHAYPDEQGIIKFVRQLENQLANFKEPQVSINTNEPVQTQQLFAPLLPVSLSAIATPSAFLALTQNVNDSPYLFQPVLLELNAFEGLQQPAKIEYRGNLFVSPDLLH